MTNHVTHWQGRTVGRYRLIQELGRGAMGEVWLAEDSQLHRQVAMKLLPAAQANDQNYLQLFAYEARAAAALDHPHILAVHDFGELPTGDGAVITYLVMPYIGGGTLRQRIRAANGPLPTGEALHYLRQAAQAIDYAHSQGVIHRDIKPANMLLQQYWLWLSDFGISKLLTSTTHLSQTTAGAGTPEFIAPEQAQGHAEPASDRYSLTIMAYQMFAGQLPFKGGNSYKTMLMQIRDTPPPPRKFNPQISHAVEKVILKGIAKQLAERFASCLELVQMLEYAWKADENTVAGEEVTDLAPWSKRQYSNPQVPIPGSSVKEQQPTVNQVPPTYTPPLANIPTFIPQGTSALPQKQKPTLDRRKLLMGGATTVAVLVVGGSFLGTIYLKHTHDLQIAAQSKPMPPSPGPHNIMAGLAVLNLTAHTGPVWNVAWDPTGHYLATAGDDTHVMLWDVGSAVQKNTSQIQPLDKPLRDWKFTDRFFHSTISWSADGRFLIATTTDPNKFSGLIAVIDVFKPNSQPQTFADMTSGQDPLPYGSLSRRPHSDTFTVVDEYVPTQIEVGQWKLGNTRAPIHKFTYNISNIQSRLQNSIDTISWSSDGSMLAGINGEIQIIVWDGNTGKELYFLDPPDRAPGKEVDSVVFEQVAWSPVDPHTLLAFNLDVVAIWDVRKKLPVLLLGTNDPVAHTPPTNKDDAVNWFPTIIGIDWSPNGRYVVSSYLGSTSLYIWDLQDTHPQTAKDGTRLQKFRFPQNKSDFGHSNGINDVAWSPNGRYVASASSDTTVIVWRVDRD